MTDSDDALRREVEERMRAVRIPDTQVVRIPAAVSVAVAMIEEERKRTGFCEKHAASPSRIYLACWVCSRLEETRRAEAAEKALADAVNYWDPPCSGGNCDKGHHNDQWNAYVAACKITGDDPKRRYDER